MSAQQLADECGRHGFAITRSALANLENGRRESLAVAELLVLATALGVAPALLLFPVGYASAVEITPDREMTPWDACRWFLGGVRVPAAKDIEPPDSPLALWADHESLTTHINRLRDDAGYWHSKPGYLEHFPDDHYGELLERAFADLKRLRMQMRGLGMTPPPVAPDVAREIGEGEADEGNRLQDLRLPYSRHQAQVPEGRVPEPAEEGPRRLVLPL